MAGRLAGENLLRALDRSLVTALAITLSVAITVGAGSLVASFRSSVSDWYGFSGDALVSSRAVGGGWLASAVSRNLEPAIRALPSVEGLQTLRVLQGQPYGGERIAIAAVSDGLLHEALAHASFPPGLAPREAGERIARGEAVAVSRNFVTHFGAVTPGERLSLASVTGPLELPRGRDRVRLRLRQGLGAAFAEPVGRTLAGRPGELLRGRPEGRRDDDGLRGEVTRAVTGADALAVTSTSSMIEKVDGLIAQAFADIDTIKLLVLFLTAVGIADLVVSNVLARRRELAVLRLVGFTGSQLVRTARIEGLCITFGAVVCGSVAGIVCAWVWVHYNYPGAGRIRARPGGGVGERGAVDGCGPRHVFAGRDLGGAAGAEAAGARDDPFRLSRAVPAAARLYRNCSPLGGKEFKRPP